MKNWIPFEIARILKEKGFSEDCIYHYKVNESYPESHTTVPTFEIREHFGRNHNTLPTRVSAPLYEQALRWLRDKHNAHVVPSPKIMWPDNMVGGEYHVTIYINDTIINDDGVRDYEESLHFGILTVLEKI